MSHKVKQFPSDGEILCNYKFGRVLGEGAFGTVKLATKQDLNEHQYHNQLLSRMDSLQSTHEQHSHSFRTHNKLNNISPTTTPIIKQYAIKILDKFQMNDLDSVDRIYRESAILTSLKHPNIIRLYEVLDTSQWVLIIMEYAGGGELKNYINKQENQILSELNACKIFNDILCGLEYCHRRKVIHRDLKLENILLADNGETIKIADFGLSNTIKFGQEMKTSCGTPSYIAPEIIKGDNCEQNSNTFGACDVWSFGVILYSMICGFLPFESSNLNDLYKQILSADYYIPDYISANAKLLIQSMLTLDIKERISIADIRNHMWTNMQNNGLIEEIKQRAPAMKDEINLAYQYNCTRKKKKSKKNRRMNKANNQFKKYSTNDHKHQIHGKNTHAAAEKRFTFDINGSKNGSKQGSKDSSVELMVGSIDIERSSSCDVNSKSKYKRCSKHERDVRTFYDKNAAKNVASIQYSPIFESNGNKHRRKNTINSIKAKLYKIKSKTATNRISNGVTSNIDKRSKTPMARMRPRPNNKKNKILKQELIATKCKSKHHMSNIPHTPKKQKLLQAHQKKRVAYHSPIVDSIMKRKSSTQSSRANAKWKLKLDFI